MEASQSVFLGRPRGSLQVNEEARTNYASASTMDVLLNELSEKGHIVGLAQIGPGCYDAEPSKLSNQVSGQDIYYWKNTANRKEHAKQNSFLIVGAKKTESGGEFVYFTLSQDITTNSHSPIRSHRASVLDQKIYVTSHKTFLNYLFDLYPPLSLVASSRPASQLSNSELEQEYIKKLATLTPLDSILDQGTGTARCKAIGQEIFDTFKDRADGNSDAGRQVLQYICNSLREFTSDGRLRKQYVERAWDGVGDNTWQWRS